MSLYFGFATKWRIQVREDIDEFYKITERGHRRLNVNFQSSIGTGQIVLGESRRDCVNRCLVNLLIIVAFSEKLLMNLVT